MKNLMIVLALGMTFGLVGCGEETAAPAGDAAGTTTAPSSGEVDAAKKDAASTIDAAADKAKDAIKVE